MTVKKLFGASAKILAALMVSAFMAIQSLNLFDFIFPADQWYLSWLGFGLTGGALIAYIIVLLADADTPLKKFISIVMIAVCTLGELATAGFGVQVEVWQSQGLSFDQESVQSMIFIIRLLGLFHATALIFYFAGDTIFKAFSDEDGDGIPNLFDMNYKGKPEKKTPLELMRSYPAEAENPTPRQGQSK